MQQLSWRLNHAGLASDRAKYNFGWKRHGELNIYRCVSSDCFAVVFLILRKRVLSVVKIGDPISHFGAGF